MQPQRLSLAALLAGCTPEPCDDDRLRAAADRQPELSDVAYIEEIAAACPKMPPGLRDTLRVTTGQVPADAMVRILERRDQDRDWKALTERTCPPSEGTPPNELSRDAAERQRCNLDRYGILAPDDPYAWTDLVAFNLLEWLQGVGVAPELARDVVLPLLTKSATRAELEAMCLQGRGGCEAMMAKRGIRAPSSTSDEPLHAGIEVTLTPAAIRVGHDEIMSLHEGRAADPTVHVLGPLRDAIDAIIADETDGGPLALQLLADADTPYRTVVDVLFTASKAGLDSTQLVVLDAGQARGLSVFEPRAWRRPSGEPKDAPPAATWVTVTADAVTLRVTDDTTHRETTSTLARRCEPGSACARALTAAAQRVKAQRPHETLAHIDADDGIRLQQVIDVADALRGPDCRGRSFETGDPVSDACLLWQPVLDATPGLFFHVDRRGRITLGEPTVRASRLGHDVPAARADELRAKVTEGIAELTACVDGSPEILRALEGESDRLVVMYGPAEDDPTQTVARVFVHGFLEDPTQRCVLDVLGATADTRTRKLDFLGAASWEVSVPLVFDDETSPHSPD